MSVQTRRMGLRWLRGVVLLAIPVALVGELGHHLLEQLGRTFAHHFFHIVFGAGAVLLFTLVIAADVRRHGWPAFSWHPARGLTGEGGNRQDIIDPTGRETHAGVPLSGHRG